MEEDRAIADLGPDVSTDIHGEDEAAEKKPKRRFIGRRAADADAAARAQENGAGIEDSGAVQGLYHTYTTLQTLHNADKRQPHPDADHHGP